METRKAGVAASLVAEALRSGPATLSNLSQAVGLSFRQTEAAALRLLDDKLVALLGAGRVELTELGFEALHAGSIRGGRPRAVIREPVRDFRARAWSAMRVRRQFTIGDIVTDAANGDVSDPVSCAMKYIRALKRSGYVRELRAKVPNTRPSGPGFKQFQLVRSTGPKAPVIRNSRQALFDRNTEELVPWHR